MAHRNNDSKLDDVMELLIENGFESFADVLRILLNEAMKIGIRLSVPGCMNALTHAEAMPTVTSQRLWILELAN